jgi:hypothetical protein
MSVSIHQVGKYGGGCSACASQESRFALRFSRASNSVTEVRLCLECAHDLVGRDLRVQVSRATK